MHYNQAFCSSLCEDVPQTIWDGKDGFGPTFSLGYGIFHFHLKAVKRFDFRLLLCCRRISFPVPCCKSSAAPIAVLLSWSRNFTDSSPLSTTAAYENWCEQQALLEWNLAWSGRNKSNVLDLFIYNPAFTAHLLQRQILDFIIKQKFIGPRAIWTNLDKGNQYSFSLPYPYFFFLFTTMTEIHSLPRLLKNTASDLTLIFQQSYLTTKSI